MQPHAPDNSQPGRRPTDSGGGGGGRGGRGSGLAPKTVIAQSDEDIVNNKTDSSNTEQAVESENTGRRRSSVTRVLQGIASDVREHEKDDDDDAEYNTDEFSEYGSNRDESNPGSVGARLRGIAQEEQQQQQQLQQQDDDEQQPRASSKRDVTRAKRVLKDAAQTVQAKQQGHSSTIEKEGQNESNAENDHDLQNNRSNEHESEEERDEDEDDGFSTGTRDAQDPEDELEPMSQIGAIALIRVATKGDVREIHRLISQGKSVNWVDRHGWTALHFAVAAGSLEVCKELLSAGAHVHHTEDVSGWTPLHVAAVKERFKIAKCLLEAGASRSKRDKYGDVPAECVPLAIKGPPGQVTRKLKEILMPSGWRGGGT